MKNELELKLQAWLDGELPADEVEQVRQMAIDDPAAGQLLAELRVVKDAFAQGESIVIFPETRDFYWSKIQRQIRREAVAPPARAGSWAWVVRRWLAPVAGIGAVAAAVLLALNQSTPQMILNKVSGASSEMRVSTFRDQAAGLNFVFLQNAPVALAHLRNDGSSFMTETE